MLVVMRPLSGVGTFASTVSAVLPTKRHRKGVSIATLWVVGLGFGITVIVLGIVAKIVGRMKANENDTTVTSILDKGLSAITELSNWLDIIALAVAGVLVIGLIVRHFGGIGFSRGGE